VTDRIVITCVQMQECFDLFRDTFVHHGVEVALPRLLGQQFTEAELTSLLRGMDGIIAGDDPLTRPVIFAADRLRVIAKWGIGTDGIDFAAARERGIKVSNTPSVFGDAVADVAMAYVLMLARQLHRIHASIVDGKWLKHRGEVLAGRTLGIAGFGDIGRSVAARARGFGMKVIAHDIAVGATDAAVRLGVELVDRAELFVLCAPLTPETRHMINRDTLALMSSGSYLVNVSRGSLVDEVALVEALASGQIAAAGLDVFEEEPLPDSSPLRRFPQCVFGSHNGSNTRLAAERASEKAVANVLRDLGHTA
jgi:D-3-phosphoglycerate dehydrogenase